MLYCQITFVYLCICTCTLLYIMVLKKYTIFIDHGIYMIFQECCKKKRLVPPLLPTIIEQLLVKLYILATVSSKVFVSKSYTNAGGSCFFKTET